MKLKLSGHTDRSSSRERYSVLCEALKSNRALFSDVTRYVAGTIVLVLGWIVTTKEIQDSVIAQDKRVVWGTVIALAVVGLVHVASLIVIRDRTVKLLARIDALAFAPPSDTVYYNITFPHLLTSLVGNVTLLIVLIVVVLVIGHEAGIGAISGAFSG